MTPQDKVAFKMANIEYNSSVRMIKAHIESAASHTDLMHSSGDVLYKLEQKYGIKRELVEK